VRALRLSILCLLLAGCPGKEPPRLDASPPADGATDRLASDGRDGMSIPPDAGFDALSDQKPPIEANDASARDGLSPEPDGSPPGTDAEPIPGMDGSSPPDATDSLGPGDDAAPDGLPPPNPDVAQAPDSGVLDSGGSVGLGVGAFAITSGAGVLQSSNYRIRLFVAPVSPTGIVSSQHYTLSIGATRR
jgi:hypothetical protein